MTALSTFFTVHTYFIVREKGDNTTERNHGFFGKKKRNKHQFKQINKADFIKGPWFKEADGLYVNCKNTLHKELETQLKHNSFRSCMLFFSSTFFFFEIVYICIVLILGDRISMGTKRR